MVRRYELWYSLEKISPEIEGKFKLKELKESSYTGLVVSLDQFLKEELFKLPIKKIIRLTKKSEIDTIVKRIAESGKKENYSVVLLSDNIDLLSLAKKRGFKTCINRYVDDKKSLHACIEDGSHFNYLKVKFKDPTNIPLELVIAKLQGTNTKIIKEINCANDVVDAKVVFGVMEVGVEGIIYTPIDRKFFEMVNAYIDNFIQKSLNVEVGEIVKTEAIGMGYRSCVDLATLFDESEGMLVGSTSTGGVLCCSEVFHLPYMDKRPFRINAGGVHSYVYNNDDTTNYMTELKAGSKVMIVDLKGNTREATVGRIKTEIRPLRLIEVKFPGGEYVNIIMQDDWHVRIFSAEGKPANITELKPGDKVLGYTTKPGRHVGVKVDEFILEA